MTERTRRTMVHLLAQLALIAGSALVLLSLAFNITFDPAGPDGSGYELLLGEGGVWFGVLNFVPMGAVLVYWSSLALAGLTILVLTVPLFRDGLFSRNKWPRWLRISSRLTFLIFSADYFTFVTGVIVFAVQKSLGLKPDWLFLPCLAASLIAFVWLGLRLRICYRSAALYGALATANSIYVGIGFFEGLTLWGFPVLYAGVGLLALGYSRMTAKCEVVQA